MSKTIVALFDSYTNAEQAARQVKEQGLKTDDISIVMKEGSDSSSATNQTENYPTASMGGNGETVAKNDNISDGVVTGGILGGLAGLLIGAGSMVVPGLGIIAAAGPITGLISGAITGGVVGGLIDLGIPEEKSRPYESSIKSGKVLFSMRTDEDNISRVRTILQNSGAVKVDSY